MENLRELYKKEFGKYPSSQMKQETLIKKLWLDKEISQVKEEDIREIPEEEIKLEVKEIKETKPEPKWIKVTTATRNRLLNK